MSDFSRCAGFLVLLAYLAIAEPAHAQIEVPDGTSTLGDIDESSASPRSRATNRLTMQENTGTLGGSLTFITAEQPPEEYLGTDTLRFTDVVMLNAGGRYSFGPVELFGSTSVLPKKPSDTDALFWQGALIGARWGIAKYFTLSPRLLGGPMLGDAGWWGWGDLELETRYAVHETITFVGRVGGGAQGLFDSREGSLESFWIAEVLVGGEIVLRAGSFAAFWAGVDFHFPVWSTTDNPSESSLYYDAQTRANVTIGAVGSWVDDWDIYAEYSFIDRGEPDDPTSVIPVLPGGFDQQQLVVGVVRYFAPDNDDW